MISPEIWQDIRTRIGNLRGDLVGQWQGDLDNIAIEQTVTMLTSSLRMWEQARPTVQPPATANVEKPTSPA